MSESTTSGMPFETERTRAWRRTRLNDSDARCIDNIERYGCHLVHVRADRESPAWSYSIGAFDTGCDAEIVVLGLDSDLAHSVVNDAVALMREGRDLVAGGRVTGLLEGVDCVFRVVEARWAGHIMNWDNWFYQRKPYRVLQCLYPDLKGWFPWEAEFDTTWRVRQPQLFAGAEDTIVEQDFWMANDPMSSLFAWKFPDGPHTGVYVSDRIASNSEPITYVSHDCGEGDWQFHGDHMSEGLPPKLMCFHHMIDRDPTINELADLPIGWCAERSGVGDRWLRSELPPEDESDEG